MAHCAGERNWFFFCETTARCTSALNTLKGYMKKQIPYIFRKKDTKHDFEKKN